jgi:general secretion pathway protein D
MMQARTQLILVASCMLPHAVAAHAQPAGPQTEATTTLSGQLDLARLLDVARLRLGVTFEYEPALIKPGAVQLRAAGQLSDDALWALLQRSLLQAGLTSVRTAGSASFMIVKIEDAPRLARVEAPVSASQFVRGAGVGVGDRTSGFQQALIRIEHMGTKEATDLLRALLGRAGSQGASVTALGGASRTLLIADQSSRLLEALRLLADLDVPTSAPVTFEVALQGTPAQQALAQVTQMLGKRDAGPDRLPGEAMVTPTGSGLLVTCPARHEAEWRALIAQADRRERAETLAYMPRSAPLREVAKLVEQLLRAPGEDKAQVLAEEPTGTLLVTTTPTRHAQIKDLMARLDAVPSQARYPMRALAVRNRPVGELLDVLREMIDAGALQAGSDADAGAGARDTSPTQPVRLPVPDLLVSGASGAGLGTTRAGRRAAAGESRGTGDELPLSLAADEVTSSILAVGDPQLVAQLQDLIATLDVPQPQIMLEALLVTISERDERSLGTDFQQLIRDGNTAITVASLFGISTPAGSGATGALNPGSGRGFTGAVIRPGDFSVVLRAAQSLGGGRSTSLPRVLTTSNQRVQFDSLDQQPYGVSFTQGNSNATNVTFGGTLDAGTRLTITPRVGQGDRVQLDYSISISSFGEAGAGVLPPSRQVTSVQSLVTVPDGHSVLVGGLEGLADSASTEQLPLLGDIPLLGEAFKSRTKVRTRSRFFVLIRATVVRGESIEPLRHFTAPAAAQAGLPGDWPTSLPQVIK